MVMNLKTYLLKVEHLLQSKIVNDDIKKISLRNAFNIKQKNYVNMSNDFFYKNFYNLN